MTRCNVADIVLHASKTPAFALLDAHLLAVLAQSMKEQCCRSNTRAACA